MNKTDRELLMEVIASLKEITETLTKMAVNTPIVLPSKNPQGE
jgi:hypothetical protein